MTSPPTARIPRRRIAVAVATRLAGVTNATGYFGQIGAKNGLPGVTGTPATPPPKSATDTRVAPYFIVEPGAGTIGDEPDLADTFIDLDQPFIVRAAAGDIQDLLALVERIDALLWRWSPGVIATDDGPVVCSPLQPRPGYTPPLLLDQSVSPARHFTPLEYLLRAHS